MLLNRRRFLIGSGGSVLALPFLESLGHAQSARPTRLVVMFHGQGFVRSKWVPAQVGALGSGRISEILEPLGAVRDRVVVMSGIGNPARHAVGGDNHRRSFTTIMTNARPESDSLAGGPSVDQVAAEFLRGPASRDSIFLKASASRNGFPIFFTRSTNGVVTPLSGFPGNPRDTAQALFATLPESGGGGPAPLPSFGERLLSRRRTMVDAASENLTRLRPRLSAPDRERLDAHAEHLHALSQQFNSTPAPAPVSCERPDFNSVASVTANATGDSGLLDNITAPAQIDNLVRALSCDLTRVASLEFNVAHDPRFPWLFNGDAGAVIRGSNGTVYSNWHDMIHRGQNNASDSDPGVPNLVRAQRFYAQMFTYLVEQLAATPDIDGRTLLDNTLVLWMSDFGHENHGTNELPVILAGLNERMPGGRHVRAEGRTIGDLFASVLDLVGAPSGTTVGMTGSIRDWADGWAYNSPRPDSYFSGLLPLRV